MNDPTTTARDDVVRRPIAAADDPDDPRPETDDAAPEEAGYGYGV
jgi:hypothetical protein